MPDLFWLNQSPPEIFIEFCRPLGPSCIYTLNVCTRWQVVCQQIEHPVCSRVLRTPNNIRVTLIHTRQGITIAMIYIMSMLKLHIECINKSHPPNQLVTGVGILIVTYEKQSFVISYHFRV